MRATGPGIPPSERERIREQLFHGDRSRGQRGLGLGLKPGQSHRRAYGGRASVADDGGEGSGATFTVTLPAGVY